MLPSADMAVCRWWASRQRCRPSPSAACCHAAAAAAAAIHCSACVAGGWAGVFPVHCPLNMGCNLHPMQVVPAVVLLSALSLLLLPLLPCLLEMHMARGAVQRSHCRDCSPQAMHPSLLDLPHVQVPGSGSFMASIKSGHWDLEDEEDDRFLRPFRLAAARASRSCLPVRRWRDA